MRVASRKREVISFVKQTIKQWSDHNAFRLSAALSYYTVFSLGPVLLLATAVAGFVFGEEAARGELYGQLNGLIGSQGAEAVQALLSTTRKPESNIKATIVGLVTLLFGASGAFAELKASLNQIFEVEPTKASGVLVFLKDRIASFAMVGGIGFLLMVSLVVSALLSAGSKYVSDWFPESRGWYQCSSVLISFLLASILFALVFKVLPDISLRWRDTLVGALTTSLLFTVGKEAIGLYLGQSGATSAYGASGSIVVVLLWAYYSSLILFLGAEFTHVYSERYGSRQGMESPNSARVLANVSNNSPEPAV